MYIERKRVYLYDTTLRDGAQTSTINFTPCDKRKVALMIDSLGIDYIEGGFPGTNHVDIKFFDNLPKLKHSKFSAFGMTKRKDLLLQHDDILNSVVNSSCPTVCIFGKVWDYHVKDILGISEEENLDAIKMSIEYIKSKNKEAIFDAEHFFDGYKHNPTFALKCIQYAYNSGARWVVLCDTNGGTLPMEIATILLEVQKTIPGENIGVHFHNDTGNAVANSLIAVEAGARHIQGTINGIGERCGNADLIALIPTLVLKMNIDISICNKKLKNLSKISKSLNNILNKKCNDFAPYIGKFAFFHKGGVHASSIIKDVKTYEHIDPALVNNERIISISNQSGTSSLLYRLNEIKFPLVEINKQEIIFLLQKIKVLESIGYIYDNANASFELLAYYHFFNIPVFFQLKHIEAKMNYLKKSSKNNLLAKIQLEVNGNLISASIRGKNIILSLHKIILKILSSVFISVGKIKIVKYHMTNICSLNASKISIRVEITFCTTNKNIWSTVGTADCLLEASYKAIQDGISFYLLQERLKTQPQMKTKNI